LRIFKVPEAKAKQLLKGVDLLWDSATEVDENRANVVDLAKLIGCSIIVRQDANTKEHVEWLNAGHRTMAEVRSWLKNEYENPRKCTHFGEHVRARSDCSFLEGEKRSTTRGKHYHGWLVEYLPLEEEHSLFIKN
jgi:hypothetical protein